MKLYEKIFNFFDKVEDHVRGGLSRHPFIYTFIGGVGVVLFWRGVWHTADTLESYGGIWTIIFSAAGSIVVSIIVLLITGLFVSVFIGDSIIISGIKKDKKVIDKTISEVEDVEVEVKQEETDIQKTLKLVTEMKQEMDMLENGVCGIKTPKDTI